MRKKKKITHTHTHTQFYIINFIASFFKFFYFTSKNSNKKINFDGFFVRIIKTHIYLFIYIYTYNINIYLFKINNLCVRVR